MKKNILFAVFIAMMAIDSFSQSIGDLPATSVIIHYKLSIGYNTTTILIFPSAVQQVDRGERDLMAQKQPGVENVLKIKAARKDFLPTNLHVFTMDGRVYAFDVVYNAAPLQTTYDLTRFISADSSNAKGNIEFSTEPLDKQKLAGDIAKVKSAKPFFSSRSRKDKIGIELQTIYWSRETLYFGFKITNRSNLPYDIGFIRLLIRDKAILKRASIQQRDITPIYTDTDSYLPCKSAMQWAIAIPKMTIHDHRQFVLGIYERNGGRNVSLQVTNRQLFRAKSL